MGARVAIAILHLVCYTLPSAREVLILCVLAWQRVLLWFSCKLFAPGGTGCVELNTTSMSDPLVCSS